MLSLLYTLHKSLTDTLGLLSLLQSSLATALAVAFNGGCSPSSGFPNRPQPQLPASHNWTTAIILLKYLCTDRIKNNSSVAAQLLLSDGTTYSTVACAAISTDYVENTTPLLLFTGHCLVVFLRVGWDWVHLVHRPPVWPVVPDPGDRWWVCSNRWNENW
jgi:hypothetical protein